MGLLRSLFWAGVLVLVLALAPDFGLLGPAADRGRERAGVQDLFYILSETASDLGEICSRRPEVCEKLDLIMAQFHNRAVRLTGAAHEWLTGEEDSGEGLFGAGIHGEREPEAPAENADDARYRLAETPPEQRK